MANNTKLVSKPWDEYNGSYLYNRSKRWNLKKY